MDDFTQLLKSNFKLIYSVPDCLRILNKIQLLGIEKFSSHNSFISSFINLLGEKLHFHILTQLLTLISCSTDEFLLEYEFKSGIKILLEHNHHNDFLTPLFSYINKKTILDEYFITTILNMTFFNTNYIHNFSTNFYIEKCFEIIYITIEKSKKNLSSSFWELVITNSLKLNQFSYFQDLVKIYPVKQFFNEKMWINIISFHMNEIDTFRLFDLFFEKLQNCPEKEIGNFFDNIFNTFLEEISNSYENIEFKKIEEIYFKILSIKNIKIKEQSISNFFEKIFHLKFHTKNFLIY